MEKAILDAQFYEYNKDRIILFNPEESLIELRRDSESPNNIHSDVWILRQQDRLTSLSDSVADLVRQRFAQKPPESNPFDGMTDDEILDNIKSKNIQTAAELKQYLLVLQAEKESRIAAYEYQKAQSAEADQPVEDTKES